MTTKKDVSEALRRRREALKLNKNFTATLLLALATWACVFMIVVIFPPSASGVLPLFFALFFVALVLTLSLVLAHTRRAVVAAAATCLFVLLRYLGIGSLVNLVLIAGVAVAFEIHFSRKN